MEKRTTPKPSSRRSASSTHSPASEIPELNWEPLPECLGHWTGFVLHWLTELGSQFYSRAMAPLNLRPLQVGILQLLAGEGAMVQARLGDRLRVDKATMVSLLNDLEQQGLVERRPHPSDRRAYEIHLLDAGRQRLQAAENLSIAAAQQFFSTLTPQEQQTLNELLRRVATSNISSKPATLKDITE